WSRRWVAYSARQARSSALRLALPARASRCVFRIAEQPETPRRQVEAWWRPAARWVSRRLVVRSARALRSTTRHLDAVFAVQPPCANGSHQSRVGHPARLVTPLARMRDASSARRAWRASSPTCEMSGTKSPPLLEPTRRPALRRAAKDRTRAVNHPQACWSLAHLEPSAIPRLPAPRPPDLVRRSIASGPRRMLDAPYRRMDVKGRR